MELDPHTTLSKDNIKENLRAQNRRRLTRKHYVASDSMSWKVHVKAQALSFLTFLKRAQRDNFTGLGSTSSWTARPRVSNQRMNSAAELLICGEMKPLANSKFFKVHKPPEGHQNHCPNRPGKGVRYDTRSRLKRRLSLNMPKWIKEWYTVRRLAKVAMRFWFPKDELFAIVGSI